MKELCFLKGSCNCKLLVLIRTEEQSHVTSTLGFYVFICDTGQVGGVWKEGETNLNLYSDPIMLSWNM